MNRIHDQTGLIYFGRRYYDPTSGRFITSDPEGYIDGPNLYAYTLNNPLTHHDPYGLYIYLNKDHLAEMATGLYHGSLSYARDTALFAGKYLGGIHGPDDMPFSDIYSAHLDAGDRFTKKTDDWMASSPYASGDLYHFSRGATYTGMDLAGGFMFPFGQMKTAGSVGKTILRAEKIAHSSPTLLKTSLVTGKLFKSNLARLHTSKWIASSKTGGATIGGRAYNSTKSTAKLLYSSWDKGTFPNMMQSIKYHFLKHGNGRSLKEYTLDANIFFRENRGNAQEVILKNGKKGFSIKRKCEGRPVGGFWTEQEKIITYWD